MKQYLSNKFIKINCLNGLINFLNKTAEKPNRLIILTANGIYTGTLKDPVDPENYKVNDNDDWVTAYHKTYLETINKMEINKDIERVSENPITITLENVEIRSNNVVIHLPFVEIFIDQIIGFSLGSISDSPQD